MFSYSFPVGRHCCQSSGPVLCLAAPIISSLSHLLCLQICSFLSNLLALSIWLCPSATAASGYCYFDGLDLEAFSSLLKQIQRQWALLWAETTDLDHEQWVHQLSFSFNHLWLRLTKHIHFNNWTREELWFILILFESNNLSLSIFIEIPLLIRSIFNIWYLKTFMLLILQN